MKTEQSPNLPTAEREYSQDSEQNMRRTIEHYLEDLRGDVVDLQNQHNSSATLALRRHQFLLMGAI